MDGTQPPGPGWCADPAGLACTTATVLGSELPSFHAPGHTLVEHPEQLPPGRSPGACSSCPSPWTATSIWAAGSSFDLLAQAASTHAGGPWGTLGSSLSCADRNRPGHEGCRPGSWFLNLGRHDPGHDTLETARPVGSGRPPNLLASPSFSAPFVPMGHGNWTGRSTSFVPKTK